MSIPLMVNLVVSVLASTSVTTMSTSSTPLLSARALESSTTVVSRGLRESITSLFIETGNLSLPWTGAWVVLINSISALVKVRLGTSLKKLRSDLGLVKADEIARRYLVLNAFDGVLATLGIIAGAYLAGSSQARVIVIAGLGASAAMGVSGAWGAYLTERAERRRAIKELETALFASLQGSTIESASRTAVFLIALVDGLSPLATSLICLSPLIASSVGIMQLAAAVAASVALALVILFSLGVFLAKISQTNVLVQGASMILAGFLIFALVYLLAVG